MTETSPPARYSIGQDDFDPEIGRRVLIRLDGIEQRQVVEYDCAQGEVVSNKVDDKGIVQIDGEGVARETLHGNVTVEWNDA